MLKEFTEAVLKVRWCDLATGISTLDSGPGSGPAFLSSSPKARQHKVPPQPRNSQAPRAYTESSRQRNQFWHVWRKDTGLGLPREPNFTPTSQRPGTEPVENPQHCENSTGVGRQGATAQENSVMRSTRQAHHSVIVWRPEPRRDGASSMDSRLGVQVKRMMA